MKTRLKELYKIMKNDLPKEKFNSIVDDIYDSEHSIFMFLRDWIPAKVGDMSDELYINAVEGMKNINSYFQNYGEEPIFIFDETDWRSVVNSASDFHGSVIAHAIDNFE